MWSRDFSETKSRAVLLIGQFIVLALCVAYIHHIYTANILPDKSVRETYSRATCLLIDKKLATSNRFLPGYRADFLISYQVNGVQYNRWVSGNGLDTSYSRSQNKEQRILSQYTVGDNYQCYYSTTQPELSVLILRHDWLSTFPLIVPTIIGILAFYYFMKTLFEVLQESRTRED